MTMNILTNLFQLKISFHKQKCKTLIVISIRIILEVWEMKQKFFILIYIFSWCSDYCWWFVILLFIAFFFSLFLCVFKTSGNIGCYIWIFHLLRIHQLGRQRNYGFTRSAKTPDLNNNNDIPHFTITHF